jgi:hypothetical protein
MEPPGGLRERRTAAATEPSAIDLTGPKRSLPDRVAQYLDQNQKF